MPRRRPPDALATALGARIRALREESGLTLEKLAYESDVGKGFLSDVERGLALPTLSTLAKIAERLDLLLLDVVTIPERSTREAVTDALRHVAPGALRKLHRETSAATKRAPQRPARRPRATKAAK